MKQHKCIIIEDEPLALKRTANFVNKVPSLELSATFDNALSGLEHLKAFPIDILFLDIKMDELSGIELLESTSIDAQIIITTAYQEYAIKGYDLNVTDYLLKPFTFQRFLQAVSKAQCNLNVSIGAVEYIFIKSEGKLVKVNYSEILYIEGMRDYRRIFLPDRSIMTLQTFVELQQLIPPSKICRVHKSYMISISKIDTVDSNAIQIGSKIIPISATYKKAFLERIKN